MAIIASCHQKMRGMSEVWSLAQQALALAQ
jgi:hypothetical protein